MDEKFKIFLEQLKSGRTERIDIACDSAFLGVKEEDLHFEGPVQVTGEAYLADDELILHFDARAKAIIPCSICNEPVEVEAGVNGFYHAEPVAEIKTGSFNYQEILREAILLEVPQFVECEGSCPQRKQVDKYLKKPKTHDDQGYQPFADINLDQFKP
jgi:uncharacterized metal-binding protein YceD (DUF177 family)